MAAGVATPIRLANMVVVPLDLHEGPGAMIVFSGRLTPLFGDDELGRLSQYSTSIVAGLDRVLLSERIAALERAKTEFLNIASHELRGPMTVIKGYLTMLEAGSLGEISTKAQSVLPLLISKSDEVNWMIEQMIEASRLEEGRLALKKQHGDIVQLTDLAVAGVRMMLAGHELEMDEPSSPIEADLDPDRFQIVIRNLLSNAAKYSPAGTAITVRVRRTGDNATVAVIDQGVGISPSDQGHLFTRFGRIETVQHVAGTGLGLWLSREIALMHDGDLTVQSAVGEGSTFLLTLPLNR
jgi:signal transduction histidine kinase